MKEEFPLVDKEYLLEKFTGKGAWTYALIPEIPQDTNAPFGWVKVSGFIDDYELKQCKLLPAGNGKLFLAVKATIRKKIKKEAGDYVRIKLYSDNSPIEAPKELLLCFENEAKIIYQNFLSLSQGEQKTYLDWIYSAKKEETKTERIANMMSKLAKMEFNKTTQ